MSEAFKGIVRGLTEVETHREGKTKLKATTIEMTSLPH
jgi:hypothetical protein